MRTIPRSVLVAFALILVALVAFTLFSQLSRPPSSGPWNQTFAYPLESGGNPGVVGQSCVDSAGYVYCIGGQDSNDNPTSSVYYAPASASGVGTWTLSTNPYPSPIVFQACASASGYVYCVGGTRDASGDDTAATYYATLSPAGVGAWESGTPYPVAIDALSCAAAVGDIYCVGGENETTGTNTTSTITLSSWYAPVSSSGIGAWSRAADYPSGHYFPSCSSLGSYMYCVAGEDSHDTPLNSTFYAYATPSGIGAWTAGPDYPIPTIAESCVTSYSSVYCVGGLLGDRTTASAVYFAYAASGTLGPWQAAPSYPVGIATDCAANSGFLYCVGGYSSNSGATGDSYFALLNATAGASSTAS